MHAQMPQDVTDQPVQAVREQMHVLRRRMVMDLEWFLSQGLAVGAGRSRDLGHPPPPLPSPGVPGEGGNGRALLDDVGVEKRVRGILLDGRMIEEKPW